MSPVRTVLMAESSCLLILASIIPHLTCRVRCIAMLFPLAHRHLPGGHCQSTFIWAFHRFLGLPHSCRPWTEWTELELDQIYSWCVTGDWLNSNFRILPSLLPFKMGTTMLDDQTAGTPPSSMMRLKRPVKIKTPEWPRSRDAVEWWNLAGNNDYHLLCAWDGQYPLLHNGMHWPGYTSFLLLQLCPATHKDAHVQYMASIIVASPKTLAAMELFVSIRLLTDMPGKVPTNHQALFGPNWM